MLGLIIAFLINIIFTVFLSALIVPFPVNDSGTVRYNSFPWMTITLISINCFVFIGWQAPDLFDYFSTPSGSPEEEAAILGYATKIWTYGFRASYLREGESIGAFTSFTSMFMHGDFNHLTGNMIYLWAFGRRVEDACGPWRFLVFYLLAGMVAVMGFAMLISPAEDLPGVGASGAISGVMGAYLLLFPGARMTCLWGVAKAVRTVTHFLLRLIGERPGPARWTIKIPAFIVLLLFIANNLLPTFDSIEAGELAGGVNYVAHVAGFLSAITIFLFVRKDLLTRYIAGRAL
ncbi:MAG: rhomboid family intramembrane serine protease [Anaerolineae bacterium]